MSNPATEKLARILKLETSTGYGDKAVTRGLQSFAPAWLADAGRNGISPEWAESIAQAMRDYSAAPDQSVRRALMDGVIKQLRTPVLQGETHAPRR